MRSPVQIRSPRFICADLQGFCGEGSGLGSGPCKVGIGTGRLDPFDFSPTKSLQSFGCRPQCGVNGFGLRDVRSEGDGREKCPVNGSFVGGAGRRAATSLPIPCLNPAARGLVARGRRLGVKAGALKSLGTRSRNWRTGGSDPRGAPGPAFGMARVPQRHGGSPRSTCPYSPNRAKSLRAGVSATVATQTCLESCLRAQPCDGGSVLRRPRCPTWARATGADRRKPESVASLPRTRSGHLVGVDLTAVFVRQQSRSRAARGPRS